MLAFLVIVVYSELATRLMRLPLFSQCTGTQECDREI
jgi:hypothetical protein